MIYALPMTHITVCICTYKRQVLLERLLQALDRQITSKQFTFSVVVADNDSAQSARQTVSKFVFSSAIEMTYCTEPRQNIALARNKALEFAWGEFVVFVDDDEYPIDTWLLSLLTVCRETGASGVLGPVVPYFEGIPPSWVLKGRFFERPTHETGYRVTLSEARTGNVLLRRTLFEGESEAFQQKFGSGGEDVDFFGRMMKRGHRFVWCNEAVVKELVPISRCRRMYLLRRALLRGNNTFSQGESRMGNLVKSVIAVPIYVASLPVCLLLGEHHFLKCLIKLCDHGGRLLALVGLNPVHEREE